MGILISIIVPIYNVQNYLDRCIKSILAQTYKNIEIILVDDGSPDDCPAMCDFYAEKDSRIKVIHKENGGLSDARNVGLKIMTGEFVLFVDSDDYINNDLCESLINQIESDIDVIQFGFRRFFDEVSGDPHVLTTNVWEFEGEDILIHYITRKHITHMVCDKMFRKSLFDNNLCFINGRLAEDLAICYQLIAKSRKFKSLDKTFYNYYTRNDSIMGTGSLRLTLNAYKGEIETYDFFNQKYPQLKKYNDERLFNQSMKVYLKLIKRYKLKENDKNVKEVLKNINRIEWKKMPAKSILFYYFFKLHKSIAWKLFEITKLS